MLIIRKGYLNTAVGQLHYRACGQSSRPPLVLLHQTPSTSAMYEKLMLALAEDYWLIAPDTPGFGQSAPLPEPASINGYANILLAGLAALNIHECFLFGHHTGASVAVQIAFNRPQFVSKLALSGPPLLTKEQITFFQNSLPALALDEDGRLLQTMYQHFSQKDATLPEAIKLRETLSALAARDHYQAAYQAVFDHDFAGQLGALTGPILLMAGEYDSLIACLEPSYRLAPQADMHVIPGAGSYLCEQNVAQVAQLLRDFFN